MRISAGIMGFMGLRESRIEALQDIFNPATLPANLERSLENSRNLARKAATRYL